MDKRYWFIRVILIAIGIVLEIALPVRLFDTASANPIPSGNLNDGFEFIWPPNIVPSEQIQLQCHNALGIKKYWNMIKCNGSSCAGDSKSYLDQQAGVEDCDLIFNVNNKEYIVHYAPPLPVECKNQFVVTGSEGDFDFGYWKFGCLWRFDLSDRTKWKAVGPAGGSRGILTGVQPTLLRFLLDFCLPGWLRYLSFS